MNIENRSDSTNAGERRSLVDEPRLVRVMMESQIGSRNVSAPNKCPLSLCVPMSKKKQVEEPAVQILGRVKNHLKMGIVGISLFRPLLRIICWLCDLRLRENKCEQPRSLLPYFPRCLPHLNVSSFYRSSQRWKVFSLQRAHQNTSQSRKLPLLHHRAKRRFSFLISSLLSHFQLASSFLIIDTIGFVKHTSPRAKSLLISKFGTLPVLYFLARFDSFSYVQVKGASEGEGLGNAFLSHISSVDGIYHCIRLFDDPDVTHVEVRLSFIPLSSPSLNLKGRNRSTSRSRNHRKRASSQRSWKSKESRRPCHQAFQCWPEKASWGCSWLFSDLFWILIPCRRCIRSSSKFSSPEKISRMSLGPPPPLPSISFFLFSHFRGNKEIDLLNTLLLITAKPVVYLINMSTNDYVRQKNKWYTLDTPFFLSFSF